MKVLFDYQTFVQQHYGGISKCFVEIIKHFPSDLSYEISVNKSKNVHLLQSNLVPNVSIPFSDKTDFLKFPFLGTRKAYSFINKCPLIPTVEKINKKYAIGRLLNGDFDIFHPTYFDDYFLNYLGGKPFVLTIHDMIPELFLKDPNNFQIRMKKKLAPLASAIIAVSENTKSDVIKLLKIPEEKIHVIYHGCPEKKVVKHMLNMDYPYFLYVGQRNGYKNFQSLVKDYKIVHSYFPNIKLVCTASTFNKVENKMIRANGLEDSIVHVDVDDEKLVSLYSYALALVYPSCYEGFGIPLLEAFTYGCPVILNNKSCFPEIASDAALYFDSDGEQSNISEVLLYFLNHPEIREVLVEKGTQRSQLYCWEKSANQLIEVYQSVLKQNK